MEALDDLVKKIQHKFGVYTFSQVVFKSVEEEVEEVSTAETLAVRAVAAASMVEAVVFRVEISPLAVSIFLLESLIESDREALC